jgi:4-oxalocrotonate tautomerase family enzyme
MPVIHINHKNDLSVDNKRRIVRRITDVFVEELNKDPNLVEIFFHDIPDYNFAKGGKLLQDILNEK